MKRIVSVILTILFIVSNEKITSMARLIEEPEEGLEDEDEEGDE